MTKQLNKKGTSLVELIAVIVIMGIIAGIAIPTTIAVINRQKKNAAVKSAQNVVDAAKSVLLEASTGQEISYVDADVDDDGNHTYSTTAADLAENSEIEKDPSGTVGSGDDAEVGTMTITYVVPSEGTAYYTVELSDGYNINGVNLYVETEANSDGNDVFAEFTTTEPDGD